MDTPSNDIPLEQGYKYLITSKKVDYYLKFIPLVTGAIILLGLMKSVLFYRIFNIQILDFISLAECLQISLVDTIFYSAAIMFILILTFFVPSHILQDFFQYKHKAKENNLKNRIISNFRSLYYNRMIFPLIILYLFTFFYYRDILTLYSLLGYLLLLFGLAIIQILVSEFLEKCLRDKIKFNANLIISSVAFAYIILSTIFFALSKAYQIRLRTPSNVVCFSFKEGPPLITTDTLVYIGKRDRYTFLFNKVTELPVIISNDNVTEMKFLKKPASPALK